MNLPSIYLASGSPRRQELLTQIGVNFLQLSVDIDEQLVDGESAADYVLRLAREKALAGWESVEQHNKRPVLGADTSVVVDDQVLGKPKNDDDARMMLRLLSGREHRVLTGVALVFEDNVLQILSENVVTFATLSNQEIDWYISTHEGNDKAGGYAVQGLSAIFIEQIAGSYSGIMGLPVRETYQLLKQIKD